MLFETRIREKLDKLFRLAAVELSFSARMVECEKPLTLKSSTEPSRSLTAIDVRGTTATNVYGFLNLKN